MDSVKASVLVCFSSFVVDEVGTVVGVATVGSTSSVLV